MRDPAAREFWRELAPKLRSRPGNTPEFEKLLANEPKGFLTDYARFDIVVEDVLVGTAPSRLLVTWNNSTYGEPDALPNELMLIALRDIRSRMPPLRKTSAYSPPAPDPNLPTVLQAPCAPAFLFKATSPQSEAVRAAIDVEARGDR